MRSTHALGVFAALVAVVTVFAVAPVSSGAGGGFWPALKVTPAGGHGYEPAVYTDHFGNIYATAHKENWQLALAADPNSPTWTRRLSWAWGSSDGRRTLAA